jgi:hypothetical protein
MNRKIASQNGLQEIVLRPELLVSLHRLEFNRGLLFVAH